MAIDYQRRQKLVQQAIERAQHKELVRRQKEWGKEVPNRFKDFDYDRIMSNESALSKDEKRAIRLFMKQESGFLLLHGPTGTGKTTAACAIVSELIDRFVNENRQLPGTPPKFYSSSELLWSLSNMNYRSDSNMENTVLRVRHASFLVIDDIGAGNTGVSEHQERVLWGLLNERYNDPDKVTIFTTNMPIYESSESANLQDWMGESMWDRISSNMIEVTFDGDSLRGEEY